MTEMNCDTFDRSNESNDPCFENKKIHVWRKIPNVRDKIKATQHLESWISCQIYHLNSTIFQVGVVVSTTKHEIFSSTALLYLLGGSHQISENIGLCVQCYFKRVEFWECNFRFIYWKSEPLKWVACNIIIIYR